MKRQAGIHGQSRTPEYRAWQGVKYRCMNPRSSQYADYGGRGIRVCGGWEESFPSFLEVMGPRPSAAHSIDRIDNNAGYDCGKCWDCASRRITKTNCRWATTGEQKRNTRATRFFEAFGRRMCLVDWANEVGIHKDTIADRIRGGMPIEEALTTRVHRAPIAFRGESLTLEGWAARLGMQPRGVWERLNRGWSLERALTTPSDMSRLQRDDLRRIA